MKIVIVGSFRYEMYAPAFAYGFRKLGHEVVEIDYEKYHLKVNSALPVFINRFQDRYHYGVLMRKYNNDIINAVDKETPDLVFFYRCYHVYSSTLRSIKDKTKLMSYNNDDPFSGMPSKRYFRFHLDNSKYCHLNYVYRWRNIIDYKEIGISNTKVLLPYFLSRQNKPIKCKKDIPIAFLGHFENDGRDEYVLRMKEAGIPIRVYGDVHWKEAPLYGLIKDVVFPEKRGAEYNFTINRCQICLVLFSKLNHDTYTRRCFEIPAAKTVMLCEFSEEMNRMFPEWECAVYFKNSDELVKKAKDLLDKPLELVRIADNAYYKLQELGGSEIDRCRQVLRDWKELCEK